MGRRERILVGPQSLLCGRNLGMCTCHPPSHRTWEISVTLRDKPFKHHSRRSFFWPTRTCLTAAQHGKKMEFCRVHIILGTDTGTGKNLTRNLKNCRLCGQHNRLDQEPLDHCNISCISACSLFKAKSLPDHPKTPSIGLLQSQRGHYRGQEPQSFPIEIDRITGLDKPYHPSNDQKNRNKYHLGTNSIELDGMNSPPKVQPGERWETRTLARNVYVRGNYFLSILNGMHPRFAEPGAVYTSLRGILFRVLYSVHWRTICGIERYKKRAEPLESVGRRTRPLHGEKQHNARLRAIDNTDGLP